MWHKSKRVYQRLYYQLSDKWWLKIVMACCIIGTGCSIGGIKYWISKVGEDQIAHDAFKQYAQNIGQAISTNWQNSLLGPQMVANLFLTNYSIDFETFARFSRPPGFWAASFGYIQAIQFIPYVLEQDRAQFEEAAQCAFPGYYIREQLANGTYIPALPRSEHFPVYFNEPYQGNEGAMGLDNTATPNRYMAYNRSRETGQPSLSERILLVQVSKFGAFILVPIFVDIDHTQLWYPGCSAVEGSFSLLVRNTTQHIFGFINEVLVYQSFFEGAIKNLVQADIDVLIFDSSPDTDPALSFLGHVAGAFSSDDNPEKYKFDNTTTLTEVAPRMEATVTQVLVVADRKWTVVVGARKGYLSARRTYAPIILLIISIVTSVIPIFVSVIHASLMKGSEPPPKGVHVPFDTMESRTKSGDSGDDLAKSGELSRSGEPFIRVESSDVSRDS